MGHGLPTSSRKRTGAGLRLSHSRLAGRLSLSARRSSVYESCDRSLPFAVTRPSVEVAPPFRGGTTMTRPRLWLISKSVGGRPHADVAEPGSVMPGEAG